MSCVMIRNIKICLLIVLALFSCSYLSADMPVLDTDSFKVEEKQDLYNGKVVIRNIGKAKYISLNPINSMAEQIISSMKDLAPSYLAEIIQIRPMDGNLDLLEQLREILERVDDYTGIPYYSVQNGTWNNLYDSAEIHSFISDSQTTQMNVTFTMNPFGNVNTDIVLNMNSAALTLHYTMTNTGKVRWNNRLTCVQPQNMKTIITVFPSPDNQKLILYALGGVKAPSFFFIRNRVDTAFINRIKSFCSYVFEKL